MNEKYQIIRSEMIFNDIMKSREFMNHLMIAPMLAKAVLLLFASVFFFIGIFSSAPAGLFSL